jgi:hypothetical protein
MAQEIEVVVVRVGDIVIDACSSSRITTSVTVCLRCGEKSYVALKAISQVQHHIKDGGVPKVMALPRTSVGKKTSQGPSSYSPFRTR